MSIGVTIDLYLSNSEFLLKKYSNALKIREDFDLVLFFGCDYVRWAYFYEVRNQDLNNMTTNLFDSKSVLTFAVAALFASLPTSSLAQEDTDILSGLQEAKSFCAKMTDDNKRMARAAGYDIGKLCNSLKDIGSLGVDQQVTEDSALILPRKDRQKNRLSSDRASVADNARDTLRQNDRTLDEEGLDAADEIEADQELQPFGYELFAGEPTTFAPANSLL